MRESLLMIPQAADGFLGLIIVKALAVAGGFALGAVLTAAFVRIACRFCAFRQPPRAIAVFTRLMGGVAGGGLTAWLLFGGPGGWGLGGFGPGAGASSAGQDQINKLSAESNAPTSEGMRTCVVMLGGPRVQGQAFYRLDNDRTAKTLSEICDQIIHIRKQPGASTALEIQVYADSVARHHPAVSDLETWAAQTGLSVTVVTLPGELPP